MTIQNGSKVSIHYTLTVEGQTVDTSQGKDPLVYVHGQGQIIPGLEEEIIGLKVGDKKSVTIPPEKAYGEVNPAAVQKVSKAKFKDAENLKIGSIIQGQAGDQEFQAIITEIGDAEITIDMNHPLAGKTLEFEVEVVEVQELS